MTAVPSRYARQENAFPAQRRRSTALIVLNAADSPWTARCLAVGGAAMGIRTLFDWHGPEEAPPGTHFLNGGFPESARGVDAEAAYDYLDLLALGEDLKLLLPQADNGWIAIPINNPVRAYGTLEEMRKTGFRYPVLLLLDAPAGNVVLRCGGVLSAMETINSLFRAGDRIEPGPPELGVLTAGVALNEVMTAGGGEPLNGVRAIAFSSHHWARRVVQGADKGPFASMLKGIACPAGPPATFRDLDIAMVGAGALGNWAALALAVEGPRLTICDGDVVEPSNLNRQIFFAAHVGRNKALALADELRAFAPGGVYLGVDRFVRRGDDLPGLEHVDLALSVPDNDDARRVCADAAFAAGALFGTAGSSGVGAQAVVCQPGRACYRCVTGRGAEPANGNGRRASCSLVEDDAVVSANMIAAGLLVNEARIALAGRRSANVRFQSTGGAANRLGRMVSDPPCTHARAREKTGARA